MEKEKKNDEGAMDSKRDKNVKQDISRNEKKAKTAKNEKWNW